MITCPIICLILPELFTLAYFKKLLQCGMELFRHLPIFAFNEQHPRKYFPSGSVRTLFILLGRNERNSRQCLST